MLDGLDSPNLAGSRLSSVREVPLGTPNFRYLLIFCHFGVPRAQNLMKMCTKMFVFTVANFQNTHYGLKKCFFGISEIVTPLSICLI